MPIINPPAASDVPVGTITPYGAATAPSSKWLICDGSAVSRTTYSVLFGIMGTSYGTGDGSTTFNLPDLRGRHAVGQGTHVDVDTLGDSDSAVLADRRPKHRHTVNDPGHTHSVTTTSPVGGASRIATGDSANQTTPSVNSATTGITVGLQTNTPVDSPAYLVVQYIIRALS